MDYIIKYLSNPLKSGVYNSLIKVDFSRLPQFFKDMAENIKADEKQSAELVELAKKIEKRNSKT
ncbi:MAG: hypothetical protein H3Z50_01225 [archaeon]|nr:hypothetical protein [archaeon]